MTKTIALLALALGSLSAHAYSGCKQDEAQMQLSVVQVTPLDAQTCQVRVEIGPRSLFNESSLCPLNLDLVLAQGFTVRQNENFRGPNCGLSQGDIVAGVLVREAGQNEIKLEQ